MKYFVLPKKVSASDNVENIKAIFLKKDLQIDLFDENVLTVDKKGGFVVLDFGKEMCGGKVLALLF